MFTASKTNSPKWSLALAATTKLEGLLFLSMRKVKGRSEVMATLICCSPTHAEAQLLVVLGMVVNREKRSKFSGYSC